MKVSIRILVSLLVIAISTQSQFKTAPSLEELKALQSIRGKIPGSIVWATSRHGTWDIYKMKADGNDKVRLTNDQQRNDHPVWSKDGRWIYFQRNNDIYRMRSDGSGPQLVVENGFSFDLSKDGLMLIYVIEEKNIRSILIRDLEKGTSEEFIPARYPEFKGILLAYPTISPDGKCIAFASDYPIPWKIHIATLDGSNCQPFADGCMPCYRPDGSMLAWISGGYHELFIGTPDGKKKMRFEDSIPGRPHCYFPRWSNNGEYIVFAASPDPDKKTSDYEIYIKPFKGEKAVRLTFHPGTDIWPDLFIANR
jgi:Tol biopolymer transport system component